MKYTVSVIGLVALAGLLLLLAWTFTLGEGTPAAGSPPATAVELVRLDPVPTDTPSPSFDPSSIAHASNTSTISPASAIATSTTNRSQTPVPVGLGSGSKIYWGAYVGGQSPSIQNMQSGGLIDAFEKRSKKAMSIVHWGQPWMKDGVLQNFQPSWFNNVRAHGSIPMLTWASWELRSGSVQPSFQSRVIYGGAYDGFLRQWAAAAKAWGHPFFLRFDWEMNGWWNPWGEGQVTPGGAIVNGNSPGDFVRMWRHVHDIFTQVGATNVTWVWCPNHEAITGQYPPRAQTFPGDAYVDWTCVDGYNRYFPPTWLSFYQVFTGSGTDWLTDSYQGILDLSPNKPMMIGETASVEFGDGGATKAAWMTDALTKQIINNIPRVKAVIWYEWDERNPSQTYPIESSPASIAAFAAGIALPNYVSNQYADLSASPIPPP